MKLTLPESPHARTRSAGLTLVEVMIAMTIGLIILAAMSNILINNLRTSREIEQVGQYVEDGRFALQTMIDDLSNAGFYGGAETVGSNDKSEVCDTTEIHVTLKSLGAKNFIIGKDDDALACAAKTIKPGTQWLAIRRFTTSSRPTTSAQTCPEGVTCAQIDEDGTLIYKTGSMTTRLRDDSYAAVYIPVTNIYYVDIANRLRRISLNWVGGTATTLDTVLVGNIGIEDIEMEGIEMLQFVEDGSQVRINLLSRAAKPTPGMKAETKTYSDLIIDGEAYVTNDSIRRSYYSVAVNIYNIKQSTLLLTP